jgi:hypothetical protein
MQTTQANLEKMESQLTQWDAKLKEITDAAAKGGSHAPKDHAERVAELKATHHAAQMKFDEFKKAGVEQWDKFRAGVEAAWTAVEAAAKRATS